jgi:hypothetical protein
MGFGLLSFLMKKGMLIIGGLCFLFNYFCFFVNGITFFTFGIAVFGLVGCRFIKGLLLLLGNGEEEKASGDMCRDS